MDKRKFIEISKSFFINPEYKMAFSKLGLTCIDAIFSFKAGKNLTKSGLARYRSRLQFKINSLGTTTSTTLFLKRYDRPPAMIQLRNWFTLRRRISLGVTDFKITNKLASAGINAPKTVCYGEQKGSFFEKRSFIITEKIPNAESLEQKLPDCFSKMGTTENLKLQRAFIIRLAAFIRKFHETNFCHRDLYFCHIFYNNIGEFYLIDVSRCFKPILFTKRFRIKDIAQIYYSAPAKYFSKTDKLRFYLGYVGYRKLKKKDKIFINKVISKTKRMAQHDIKHNRCVPFMTQAN